MAKMVKKKTSNKKLPQIVLPAKIKVKFFSLWWQNLSFWLYLAFICLLIIISFLVISAIAFFWLRKQHLLLIPPLYLIWWIMSACLIHGISRNAWAFARGLGKIRYPIFSLAYCGRGMWQLTTIFLLLLCWLGFAALIFYGLMHKQLWCLLVAFLFFSGLLFWQWFADAQFIFLANHQLTFGKTWKYCWQLRKQHPLLSFMIVFIKHLLIPFTLIPIIGNLLGLSIILSNNAGLGRDELLTK